MDKTAVRVTYWTRQEGAFGHEDLKDIDKFREDLAENYVAVVHGRPGDLGGLYHLTVEFISSISLADFAKFVGSGIAYDFIKEGTKTFLLRPFLSAYQNLLAKNQERKRVPYIEELHIQFQAATVTIREIYSGSITKNLEAIMRALASTYPAMVRKSGEPPVHIYIPVFEDPAEDRLVRFREPLDVDETYSASDADYLRLWGVDYDYARESRVFDVRQQMLLEAEFFTRHRYDLEWNARFALRQAREAGTTE